MKTKSIRYLAKGGAEYVEVDVRDPGPGEVQIEIAACGICQLDIFAFRHGADQMPFTPPPGHEGIGYVTKLGPGVTSLKVGDRVAAGNFTKVATIPAASAHLIPRDSKLPDELWVVEPVSCCVTGIDTCYLKPGDRVAVIGCGFMGLIIVQGLAHSCLDRLVGIDINPNRLQMAKQFGVDTVYNSATGEVEKAFDDLKALQFDVVVETSGTQAGIDLATKLTRTGGRINLFGWSHGPISIDGNAWHLGGFSVINSSPMGQIRNTFGPAIRLMHRGVFDLKPLVTHVIKMNEYLDFMQDIGKLQQDGYIKGVVKLD